jgi:hypothetical protein
MQVQYAKFNQASSTVLLVVAHYARVVVGNQTSTRRGNDTEVLGHRAQLHDINKWAAARDADDFTLENIQATTPPMMMRHQFNGFHSIRLTPRIVCAGKGLLTACSRRSLSATC